MNTCLLWIVIVLVSLPCFKIFLWWSEKTLDGGMKIVFHQFLIECPRGRFIMGVSMTISIILFLGMLFGQYSFIMYCKLAFAQSVTYTVVYVVSGTMKEYNIFVNKVLSSL